MAQWRATCDEIRDLAAGMADADLQRPFWMPLFRGWSDASEGFEFTRAHDLGEFLQLRFHMGRDVPVPSAGVARAFLARMLGSFPAFLNREAAGDQTFTAVMEFIDPGVGDFTLAVSGGAATFSAGAAPSANLVLTQSVMTFVKKLNGMHDPAAALQSGEIQVNDF